MIVQIYLESPVKAGNYDIKLFTFNYVKQKVISTKIHTIEILDIFGTCQDFKVHPVQIEDTLRAGEKGPLELTFFLRKLLPHTDIYNIGKIIITVQPALLDPRVPGVERMACFFYQNVPAEQCEFITDTTPTRNYTKIILKTPKYKDMFYQRSEVPITITTTGGKVDGIYLQ